MAFNLNDFKTNGVPFGGARPSLFDVTITYPNVLAATNAAQKFTFQCQAAELPPSTIGVVPMSYFGRKIPLNGDREYPPWRVQILNDEDFSVRTAFENWHIAMNSIIENVMDPAVASVSATSAKIGASYKTVAVVNQYRKDGTGGQNNNEGDILRAYRLDGIFPSQIGEIRLGWDMNNQVEVYTVEFVYDWWVPLDFNIPRSGDTGAAIGG